MIVQKDVKPVKYHLMRAYLKLRRLLRPFEATYVFLNDRHTFVKRRQQTRKMALKKGRSRKGTVSSSSSNSLETRQAPSGEAQKVAAGQAGPDTMLIGGGDFRK